MFQGCETFPFCLRDPFINAGTAEMDLVWERNACAVLRGTRVTNGKENLRLMDSVKTEIMQEHRNCKLNCQVHGRESRWRIFAYFDVH